MIWVVSGRIYDPAPVNVEEEDVAEFYAAENGPIYFFADLTTEEV